MRAILRNPRYTGFEVWNKQRKDEVLLTDIVAVLADADPVALTSTPDGSVGVQAHPVGNKFVSEDGLVP